jgi:hypothetical protein
MLKVEDIERQAILERAGWAVVRIPYRKWIRDPGLEIQRVVAAIDLEAAMDMALRDVDAEVGDIDGEVVTPPPIEASPTTAVAAPAQPFSPGPQQRVTREEAALVNALREGASTQEDLFVRARDLLGSQRLTQKLRLTLQGAAAELSRRKLITSEDGEYFLLPAGRAAQLVVTGTSVKRASVGRGQRPAYRGRYRY